MNRQMSHSGQFFFFEGFPWVKIFLSNIFDENGELPSDIPLDPKNSIRVVHKSRILKNFDFHL